MNSQESITTVTDRLREETTLLKPHLKPQNEVYQTAIQWLGELRDRLEDSCQN